LKIFLPLAEKYAALVELRARRDELEARGYSRFPRKEAAGRRRRFRALARRFPSALTELELPAEELRRRHAITLRGLRGEASAAEREWARSVWLRHLLLRLALAARRRGREGGERLWARLEGRGEGPLPDRARIARTLGISPETLLDWVFHPPGGQLRPLVDHVVHSLCRLDEPEESRFRGDGSE